MRSVFLAAAFGFAASQAGAVAMSSASGSVDLGLVLHDPSGDAGKLSSSFIFPPFADPFRSPDDPSTVVGGQLDYETFDDWPDDVSAPPLPFSASASAKVTAVGAPPVFSDDVIGEIDDRFEAVINIENTSDDTVRFTIMLDYVLDASVSFDRPGEEDFATLAEAYVEFALLDDNFDLIADISDFAFADADPFGPILTDTVSDSLMWEIVLGRGEFVDLDIRLGVIAEAAATPVPVPPAMALLPAAFGLMAALRRRGGRDRA
jgi:hypothetical protein